MGVTPRHAERLFRERVGLSPKLFLRIVRFQRALEAVRDARATASGGEEPRGGGNGSGTTAARLASWAEIAVSLGYYDQPHFIRDFREFAGESPGAWGGDAQSLAGVFSAVRRDRAGPRPADVAFFQDAQPARA
jgi:AraC-like DNA-binding protein